MWKNVKVKSKIAPDKVATIRANYELVRAEKFDMLDYVNGLVIDRSYWKGDKYSVLKVTCPKCDTIHVEPEIKKGGEYWPDYIKCDCDLRIEFLWDSQRLNCEVYKLNLPEEYELAESE